MFDGVTILMDRAVARRYAGATCDALAHAAAAAGLDLPVRELGTDAVEPAFVDDPGAGVVIGPGSPYHDPERVLQVIRSARERGVPLVGT